MDIELTAGEKRAISTLKRLAKRWPERLWLWSGSGSLHVMVKDEKGERAMTEWGGGVDPDYIAETIRGIDNDGGDW